MYHQMRPDKFSSDSRRRKADQGLPPAPASSLRDEPSGQNRNDGESERSAARRVGFLATQDELLGQARTSLNLIILSRMTCCLPDSAIKYSMAQCVILNLVLYVRRNLARETERERAEGGGGSEKGQS